MAWGGGGMFGGGAGNPGGAAANANSANAANGLPFAGIPDELREGVEKLTATEPDHGESTAVFSHRNQDHRPLALRRMFSGALASTVMIAGVMVTIEAVTLQAGPVLTQIGIDKGIAKNNWPVIAWAGILFVVAVVATMVASSVRVRLTGRLSADVMQDLRVRIFTHLQRLSLDYYTDEKAGVIMTRMTSDVENLQVLVQDGLVQFAVQGLTMLVITAILFYYNVTLALITILLIVPPLTGLSLWFRSASDRGFARVRDGIAGVLSDLSESLSGVRVVASHNRQPRNIVNHRNVVGVYRDANDYTARLTAVYGPGTEVMGFVGQAIILLIGGRMVDTGSLSVGELVAFILFLNQFFAPIQQLVQLYNTYQQGQSSVDKLRELLATDPSVLEKGGRRGAAAHLRRRRARPSLLRLQPPPAGAEERRPAHPGGRDDLLRRAHRGRQVDRGQAHHPLLRPHRRPGAHRRPRPAGRDPRVAPPPAGGGSPGAVPLRRGPCALTTSGLRPSRRHRRGALGEAVDRVGLRELGRPRLPQGLDTPVHERGVSLSSGERQLLALGRAFLAPAPRKCSCSTRPRPTLDLKSEGAVEAALDVLLEGRTAIIVAHRLSTAMKADRIVVVDEGGIVESGPHAQLVAAGGRYAEMYASWSAHLGDSPAEELRHLGLADPAVPAEAEVH